ncbi:hypothetical protein PTSG_12398 [Salpingoeca rosetta]|uniref:Uncharacterized protein n=1 Tax=Salpingoeca rosetta (strain ATCC 50818 / BSB-021) TaxID=946362 RepID=F2UDQ5_SALR5|nr:uncharacterized protein PTSG_12398 [Salpingoeca rosetta]EGD74750.1 hypothetical protein PTSG_12398 [Salpingoeca rosetta]|eukprot:XP_004993007.1 hypothetical protein PTSG_12398 [Salpingoeca rosetta]
MCDTRHKHCQPTVWQQHPRCTRQGHWQLAIGDCGVVASNGLSYSIPPFDATPTTSVLIISPSSTTAAAVTAAVTATVDDTTTINSLQAMWALQAACAVAHSTLLYGSANAVATTMLSVPDVVWCEFHHRDGLDVSMPLFSMVTFIHSHRSDAFRPHTESTSSPSDALPSLLILMPCSTTSPSFTTTGTLCWCAPAGGLAKSAWAERGRLDMTRRASRQRKSSTSTRTQSWRWRPSLGSSSWLRVPSPSLSSITTCCPTRTCWTGRRPLSRQLSSPSTNHHCSGGMNRRALPCDDHPATLVRLRKQQQQLTPQSKRAMSNVTAARLSLSFSPSLAAITTTTTAAAAANTPSTADAVAAEDAPPPPLAAEHIPQPTKQAATNPSPNADGSWLFAAGNRWRQHKLRFRLEAAAAEVMHTHKQDEGNVEDTCHACQLHSPHTCSNSPDSAAAAVLMQCSHMREQGGRLRDDRWRMMGGCTHDGLGGAAVDTHIHGHGGGGSHPTTATHSAITIITTITIDRTAAITRRLTPAPIWREADLAHVTRSHDEEAHEAVEPTTMKMTSDEAAADGWLHLDERALCLWAISSSSSSSSSLVTNSGCDRECGGCDVRRCAVASHDDDAGGGETVAVLFPSPHDTTRAIHAHTNVRKKKAQAFPMRCVELLRRDRDSGQHRHTRRQAGSLLLVPLRVCAVHGVWTRPVPTTLPPFISPFCSISDDDGDRGM